MAGRKTGKRNEAVVPKITYSTAMELLIDGEQVRNMTATTFTDWLDETISGLSSAEQEVIRKRLMGHDMQYAVDRWSALVILLENHVEIGEKTGKKAPIRA